MGIGRRRSSNSKREKRERTCEKKPKQKEDIIEKSESIRNIRNQISIHELVLFLSREQRSDQRSDRAGKGKQESGRGEAIDWIILGKGFLKLEILEMRKKEGRKGKEGD